MLRAEKIQFLFYGFSFFAMSKSFCVRFRLFVVWNIILLIWEFFTSAQADGLLLVSEW